MKENFFPDRNVDACPALAASRRPRLSASAIDKRPGARAVTHPISQRPGPVASGQRLAAGSSNWRDITSFHHILSAAPQTLKAAGDLPRQPQSEPRSAAERRPRKENPVLQRRVEKKKLGFYPIKEKYISMYTTAQRVSGPLTHFWIELHRK